MQSIQDFDNIFFIGVAGSGMCALAQYLAASGKQVSGSDRYFSNSDNNSTKKLLEAAGVKCFPQDGSGISPGIDLVIVSTAIENTVPEVIKAKELSLPIIRRSELLSIIADSKKTIAVAGTSGKSTTSAILFDILKYAGLSPSIISGAGLISIIEQGRIGNAEMGEGDWLIIEADESDGSIVQYKPETGLLLNIDKDHQEMEELVSLFTQFKHNTKGKFIVNRCNDFSRTLSISPELDFSTCDEEAGYKATDFSQTGFEISFMINEVSFKMNSIGRHNMENALAAVAVAAGLGVDLNICAEALKKYKGIYRRNQLLGTAKNMIVIDDYAHNPVKCAAAIKACQALAPKVIAWFQPHGYGPTRFLKNDFIHEIAGALRPADEVWMSEIFYAGGTAERNISANDLITGIREKGANAFFVENRDDLADILKLRISEKCVLLLMGARDPGLEYFTKDLFNQLKQYESSY